jgi:hypothetical protein
MAAFWTVILKNNSGSTIILEDFGVTIANTTTYTISDFFDYSDIADSKELDVLVAAGAATGLVINDGVSDFTPADGVNYIKRDNIYNDLDTHYTKTELNTSAGGSAIHWDNITNAPSFGSPTWINPVLYRVVQVSGSEPVGPDTGDVYVDTDDQHYYKWDGAAWVDGGSAAAADRIINLFNNPEVVEVFNGTDTWTPSPEEADNSAVMINDDGDGKNSQYVYSGETGEWIKIADVDFDDHLDGGAGKHTASQIDVESTTLTNITTAPGTVEAVITDIDTLLTEALDNNTLDGAYDEGGPGAGKTINADSGAVVINSGVSTTAPLEITPKAALPTGGLADGQIAVSGGIMFIYDGTRAKWLSVQRQFLVFGRKGKSQNQYLNFGAGTLASNNSGYRLARNATIVSMTAQVDDNTTSTVDVYVRKNDATANIATLTIGNGAIGASAVSTSVDILADEYLQGFIANTATCEDPMFVIEIAYRL